MSHHMKDPEQQMAYWLTLQKRDHLDAVRTAEK